MKVVAVIQARLGSTRLPGKVLLPIGDRPMIWHIYRRVSSARTVSETVVATADNAANRPLIEYLKAAEIPWFAGSEDDVAGRFYAATKPRGADVVVRVTGDCPLIDPGVLDQTVQLLIDNPDGYDYVANNRPPTFPHGLDLDVLPMRSLEWVIRNVTDGFDREWFTTLFFEHPERWRLGNLTQPVNMHKYRWTVDYPEDLELVRRMYERLDRPDRVFTMEEAVRLMEAEPNLPALNAKYLDLQVDRGVGAAREEYRRKLAKGRAG